MSYYTVGLRVYDVIDGAHPVLVGEYDTYDLDTVNTGLAFEGAFGVYPYTNSGKILVSDSDSSLLIFDFKPPIVGTEVVKIEGSFSFSISPNPASNGSVTLFISNMEMNEEIKIQLLDATGKQISDISFKSLSFAVSKEIPLTNLSKGLYFIRAVTKNKTSLKKMLVQ